MAARHHSIVLLLLVLLLVASPAQPDCGCKAAQRTRSPAVTDKSPKAAAAAALPPSAADADSCHVDTSTGQQICSSADADGSTIGRLLLDANANMSAIPGGAQQRIGTDTPVFREDHESPVRLVDVAPFLLDRYEVSNAEFARFVEATAYQTDAEHFGDSFMFKFEMSAGQQEANVDQRVASAPWWYKVGGVSWRQPEGAGSTVDDRPDHPVVHVSWRDASAFCKWRGKRLPTEAEWETACRGGKRDKLFPWGNKLQPHDQHWMNIWQGDQFPDNNLAEDGHASTGPVTQFRQNDYDLYSMVGNVWEWTSDLWDPEQRESSMSAEQLQEAQRVKKGGSFLCHQSYCYRYRCAARSQNTADSSASNLGFRCAADV